MEDPREIEQAALERAIYEWYEWGHIANDAVTAMLFLLGSIFFLYPDMERAGVWLFILGSAQMAIGPIIRTANKIHERRFRKPRIQW